MNQSFQPSSPYLQRDEFPPVSRTLSPAAESFINSDMMSAALFVVSLVGARASFLLVENLTIFGEERFFFRWIAALGFMLAGFGRAMRLAIPIANAIKSITLPLLEIALQQDLNRNGVVGFDRRGQAIQIPAVIDATPDVFSEHSTTEAHFREFIARALSVNDVTREWWLGNKENAQSIRAAHTFSDGKEIERGEYDGIVLLLEAQGFISHAGQGSKRKLKAHLTQADILKAWGLSPARG